MEKGFQFVSVGQRVLAQIRATRSDTWAISVSINGINWGIFDKKSGGQVDSDTSTYKPGAMAPPIVLGASKTTENVTLERNYRLGRDHDNIQKLYDAVGSGRVVVSQQPLDADGNVYGNPIVYRGILKRVKAPDTDSESDAAAMLELEVQIEGYPHKA